MQKINILKFPCILFSAIMVIAMLFRCGSGINNSEVEECKNYLDIDSVSEAEAYFDLISENSLNEEERALYYLVSHQ